jgi:hypothetical protein
MESLHEVGPLKKVSRNPMRVSDVVDDGVHFHPPAVWTSADCYSSLLGDTFE